MRRMGWLVVAVLMWQAPVMGEERESVGQVRDQVYINTARLTNLEAEVHDLRQGGSAIDQQNSTDIAVLKAKVENLAVILYAMIGFLVLQAAALARGYLTRTQKDEE